ncbi:MAG: hypothetical protein FJ253_09345 [Phycisphaerae bacterium]|nr:hypothetical protein [Phycisphaerae bacterium]
MSEHGATSARNGGHAAPPAGIPGPVFVRWFGAFFVLLSIGTFLWGWMVAGGVKREAALTDNAMRTVAWELLRWSAGHDGAFPRSETEFLDGMRDAMEPPAPPPVSKPGGPTAWPPDAKTALLGRPPALLPEALARVRVDWPPRSDVAPDILADGKPTLTKATSEDVREWLRAWLDAQRLRPRAPSPSSARLPS